MTGWYKLVDRKPVPANNDEFAEIFNDENRTVGLTILPCGGRVSTVFLGLDHSHGGDIPILFESMLFTQNSHDEHCVRYHTWEQAERGHHQMVMQYGGVAELLDEDLFEI